MPALCAWRGRLPLVVFVLLLFFVLLVFGVACLCLADHPSLALERVIAGIVSLPAIALAWQPVTPFFGFVLLLAASPAARARPSPQTLQRFLL